MYRCSYCPAVAPARQSRLVHVLRRTNGSVLAERPVCAACHSRVVLGVPLAPLVPVVVVATKAKRRPSARAGVGDEVAEIKTPKRRVRKDSGATPKRDRKVRD